MSPGIQMRRALWFLEAAREPALPIFSCLLSCQWVLWHGEGAGALSSPHIPSPTHGQGGTDGRKDTREPGSKGRSLESRRDSVGPWSLRIPGSSMSLLLRQCQKYPRKQNIIIFIFMFMVRLSERTDPEDFIYHHPLQGPE